MYVMRAGKRWSTNSLCPGLTQLANYNVVLYYTSQNFGTDTYPFSILLLKDKLCGIL